ncbi:DUF1592 domain-containing protein [Sandaracinus amylolyticus]|uniref:DUF1592 domain-containing protein n=1 Tax=Sandaracinus amylolyticus TaxID=927083 RepID=UPI001F2FB66B|nr:DUF1592 domain-containing protein [Sandaracinus amylolyticus]UJR85448.1 Hypothetical protein I5071_75280 [Sandaracinus amylolyticus]
MRRCLVTICLLLASCVGSLDSSAAGPRGLAPVEVDPGHRPPQRLSNREYDQTIHDLVGTSLSPGATFVAEEEHGFDHIAEALGATPTQVESYLDAGETIAADVFARPELRSRIVTCDVAAEGAACLQRVLRDFGLRAWRRPLQDDDVQALVNLHTDAVALGLSPDEALQHVVATMLASPQFLYRLELDHAPGDTAPQPLDAWELASRLSYFLWSTMPDARLFELAESGALLEPEILDAEVDRMLDDERAIAFVQGFAGQWLRTARLRSHRVLDEIYPQFDEPLRAAMSAEADAFFLELVRNDAVPVTEMLTSDAHFVDARLAQHYGVDGAFGDAMERITIADPERRGVLGLAAVLTVTSYAHRTSPTLRAKYVLGTLLCDEPPPPPPLLEIPDLDGDEAANEAAALDNVRERLELHRSNPQCAGCHAIMDPIGLGLERFDAIGALRATYPNGDAIDARGTLPNGVSFDGLGQLAQVIADDPRFEPCVARTMYVYALGRREQSTDPGQLRAIETRWRAQGTSMRALVHAIVSSNAFRNRRAEPRATR